MNALGPRSHDRVDHQRRVNRLLGAGSERRRRIGLLLSVLPVFMSLVRVASAGPVPYFTVNTTADGHAAHPVRGVCETAPGNGQCSLRAALEITNSLPAGAAVTISIPAGHYVLHLGELDLAPSNTPASVTIQGSGADATILDGNRRSPVLVITAAFGGIGTTGWLATVDGLTIQNGQGTGGPQAGVVGGGLVNNFGTVALSHAVVRHNTVSGGAMINGGGIANHGSLTISNSAISENSVSGITQPGVANATVTGGGIGNGGPLTLSRTTINSNSVTGGVGVLGAIGGGVSNRAPMTLTNATISGNSLSSISGAVGFALIAAGGLANFTSFPTNPMTPPVGLTNGTISGNIASGSSATALAGGLAVLTPLPGSNPFTLANSIVAKNTGGDCAGGLGDQGYNLDGDGSCALSTANHDFPAIKPKLGPLQLNAPGNIKTMALSPGSAAIDAGGTLANGCAPSDERGVSRPQGPACDIGAYEVLVVNGASVSQMVSPVAQKDHLVKINNRSPGLTNLRLQVNGTLMEVEELRDLEQRTVDISAALQPGFANQIVLSAVGESGSAEIRIEPESDDIEESGVNSDR